MVLSSSVIVIYEINENFDQNGLKGKNNLSISAKLKTQNYEKIFNNLGNSISSINSARAISV